MTTLDADTVVAVVGGVAQARLHDAAGVGTYLPGRTVPGVRVTGDVVEVHVALVWPSTVAEAADAVRTALLAAGASEVDVVVGDVVLPPQTTAPTMEDTDG